MCHYGRPERWKRRKKKGTVLSCIPVCRVGGVCILCVCISRLGDVETDVPDNVTATGKETNEVATTTPTSVPWRMGWAWKTGGLEAPVTV
jgi:hypothetical protein